MHRPRERAINPCTRHRIRLGPSLPTVLAAAALLVQGCGGGGDGATGPQPAPSILIQVQPGSVTVAPGGSATATASVTRGGGFTGAVVITLEGLPSGVTGTVAPTQTSGATTQAALIFQAGASPAPGNHPVTLRAQGAGVSDATVTLTLLVSAPAGDFGLTLDPAALQVAAGSSGTVQVAIQRTSFAGAVALSVGGEPPAGVTATFDPAQPGGTSSTLTLSVAGGTQAGSHTLAIQGTGTPGTRSATLNLTIIAGGGTQGNVVADFVACPAGQRPIWFAYQNGSGPWTRVQGQNHVYAFPVGANGGGFAWAIQSGGSSAVQVQYFASSEITGLPLVFCASGTKTVAGTAAGLAGNDQALVSLGEGVGTPSPGSPAFQITGVRSGVQDLVAYRFDPSSPGTRDRVLIRRDLDIPEGGSVGTVDLGGAESFAPAQATATVTGAGGDPLIHLMGYHTGPTCSGASLYTGPPGAATSFPFRGIPAARQRSGDVHVLTVTAFGGTVNRIVQEWFHALADRAVALPPAVTPTVIPLQGPYKRLQATFTIPEEYLGGTGGVVLLAWETVQRRASVAASFARLPGANAQLAMPDLTGVEGFDVAWVPGSGEAVAWLVQVTGNHFPPSATTPPCADGGWLRSVQVAGAG